MDEDPLLRILDTYLLGYNKILVDMNDIAVYLSILYIRASQVNAQSSSYSVLNGLFSSIDFIRISVPQKNYQ